MLSLYLDILIQMFRNVLDVARSIVALQLASLEYWGKAYKNSIAQIQAGFS